MVLYYPRQQQYGCNVVIGPEAVWVQCTTIICTTAPLYWGQYDYNVVILPGPRGVEDN